MGDPRVLAGLEVGSRHFILAAGYLSDRHRLVVRALESIPAHGVQRGILSDPIECADTVARLIRQAERSLGLRVNKVLAALHGNHVKSTNASASVPIPEPGAGISRRDVERAVNACRTLGLEYDRQIIHAFERGFAVDGQSGIKDPVGLYGTRLTAELHLVTAQNLAVQNLLRVLQRAGLEVEELVLPGLAVVEVVLSDLDKDLGVTLIRGGEFQTEILLFSDGAVRETFLIPWGTDSLLETLSRSFKVPSALAEQLLEQIRSLEEPPEGSSVSLRVRSGHLTRSFPQGQVVHLARVKTKEFLSRLRRRLEESLTFRESAAGIVMVGGLARLEGFLEMAESLLNMPVRLGTVREVELDPSICLASLHTTAVGLLHHATRRLPASIRSWPLPPWLKWLERPRRLLEDYF